MCCLSLCLVYCSCDFINNVTVTAVTALAPSTAEKGMKTPKLEVPTFDGQTINWNSFWEQI